MQVSKKHFPAVGLLSLVLIGVAAGSIYYYQFVVPEARVCATPVHRLIFMEALIQESPFNGFRITSAAIWNETSLPPPPAANYTSQDPRLNFTGVQFTNYTVTDSKVIEANAGDTITVYMTSVSVTSSDQYSTALGHGFGVVQFAIPDPMQLVEWGRLGSTTFTVSTEGFSTFRCLHVCSDDHGLMTGSLAVSGCA